MRTPPAMYMNGIARGEVIAQLERNGGRVGEVEPNTNAGVEFESYDYAVTTVLEDERMATYAPREQLSALAK
jgi:hypothetical protein